MMKKQNPTGLRKLLEDQVADMYYSEKKLVIALGKIAKAAESEELKEAFEAHREETKGQVERLEHVFKALGKTPRSKRCPAIDGIIEEGKEIMEEFEDDPALDAGLVAAGQKAEHYEIATYGFMCEWAKELGLTDVQKLLHETLEEEKAADEKLTSLAQSVVNAQGEEV